MENTNTTNNTQAGNTTAPTAQPTEAHNDKMMAILAYIIFFIPLLVGKRSPFVNYHTNQGTVLFVFAVLGNIALGMIPFIGWTLMPLFHLLVLVLGILGIINVTKDKTAPLPLVGGFTIIK